MYEPCVLAELRIGPSPRLLGMSARSSDGLSKLSSNPEEMLLRPVDQPAAASAVGARPYDLPYRSAFVCGPSESLQTALARTSRRAARAARSDGAPRLVFVFPGAGVQYAGMARELYANEPVFREAVDEACQTLNDFGAHDPRDFMLADVPAQHLDEENQRPSRAGVAILVYQMAMARLLSDKGISPDAVVGHSLGEYCCAVVSGSLKLANALQLMHTRGLLLEKLGSQSAMTLVLASKQAVESLLGPETYLTAYNAPQSHIVSGSLVAIEQLHRRCDETNISYRRIKYGTASHCEIIDPVLTDFVKSTSGFVFDTPHVVEWWSTVTGQRNRDLVDAEYWCDQFRSPVLFSQTIAAIAAESPAVFVEIGPQNGLVQHITSIAPNREIVSCSPNWRDPRGSVTSLLECLGALWCRGFDLKWDSRTHLLVDI
jgi:acyl transferase domain-containing protein